MHLTYKYGVQYAAHKQTHSNDYAFLFLLIHLIFEVVCVYIGKRVSERERKKKTQTHIAEKDDGKRAR